MTFNIYIGADNKTGRVDRELIESTLNKRHEGYTLLPSVGYWHGKREQSLVAIVADAPSNVLQSVKELKRVLNQEAVAYQLVNDMEFI